MDKLMSVLLGVFLFLTLFPMAILAVITVWQILFSFFGIEF